eukprot:352421-Chlamydomonas_euryale.AAC.49
MRGSRIEFEQKGRLVKQQRDPPMFHSPPSNPAGFHAGLLRSCLWPPVITLRAGTAECLGDNAHRQSCSRTLAKVQAGTPN